jgi:hypothetical protein
VNHLRQRKVCQLGGPRFGEKAAAVMRRNGLEQARGYLSALDLLAWSRAECERSQILRAYYAPTSPISKPSRSDGAPKGSRVAGDARSVRLMTACSRPKLHPLQKCVG